MGFPDAAKECLLKRVRALGGAGWQVSQDKFETYARASLALCRAYLQASCPVAGEGLLLFLHRLERLGLMSNFHRGPLCYTPPDAVACTPPRPC